MYFTNKTHTKTRKKQSSLLSGTISTEMPTSVKIAAPHESRENNITFSLFFSSFFFQQKEKNRRKKLSYHLITFYLKFLSKHFVLFTRVRNLFSSFNLDVILDCL